VIWGSLTSVQIGFLAIRVSTLGIPGILLALVIIAVLGRNLTRT
jgi:hypothetical protein